VERKVGYATLIPAPRCIARISVLMTLSCQDYCSPRVNYAEVRARVAHAFAAKASELGDAIALVQGLSKESMSLLDQIHTYCGSA